MSKSCNKCSCFNFTSAFACIACDGKWEDHVTVYELEGERKAAGKPTGEDFKPLSDHQDIQEMVFNSGDVDTLGEFEEAKMNPFKKTNSNENAPVVLKSNESRWRPQQDLSRPEKSVRMMHVTSGGKSKAPRVNAYGKTTTGQRTLANGKPSRKNQLQ